MNSSLSHSAGTAVGVLFGLVIAFIIIRFSNNNKKYRTEYDERQLKARGDAYSMPFTPC